MKRNTIATVLVCGLIGAAQWDGFAAPGQLLTVKNITGKALVKTPSAGEFTPAEKESVYPWGNSFVTGKDSGLEIEFSEGNSLRMAADSQATIDRTDKLIRVSLTEGVVQIVLNEAFHRANKLEVATESVTATPTGSDFSVGAKKQNNTATVVVNINDGKLDVSGANRLGNTFRLPGLGGGKQVAISVSDKQDLVAIRCLGDEAVVLIPDAGGKEKSVKLNKGQSLRIAIEPSADDKNIMILTFSLIAEDGNTVLETWTTTVDSTPPPVRFPGRWEDDDRGHINPRMIRVTPPPPARPTPTPVGDR